MLDARPARRLNIRRRGEDMAQGGRILPEGVVIGARQAAALAAVGMGTVPVRRRLRVAFFCTGGELRQPGETLAPGQIWNANRFAPLAALSQPWIALSDLGAVPDAPAALTETQMRAAAQADLIVSTGGVSEGDEDHMPRLLREAGGEIHAMRVAMKPGKPLAVGRLGGAIYVGLPGDPVSAFLTWMVIGARIAAARAGIADHAPRRITVRAGFDLDRRPGRCEFRPARIADRDAAGAHIVDLLSPSFSARIALLAAADGLAILPAEEGRIRRGALPAFTRLRRLLAILPDPSQSSVGRIEVDLPISRTDLASLLGIQPEPLTRLLRRAGGEGLIEIRGRRIAAPRQIRLRDAAADHGRRTSEA